MCEGCEERIHVGHQVHRIDRSISKLLEMRVKEEGLDEIALMHGWILRYLYEHQDKEIYQKTMETEFHMAKSTVTSILQAMERSGYITREGVAHDARLKKILLTEEGKKLYRDSEEYIRGVEKRIRGDIPQEDLDVFMRTVMQMEENLKNYEIEATAK